MSAWRRSRLARFTVALILAWTALDISNAWLCSLDGEALRWSTSPLAVATVEAGVPPGSPAPDAAHVDDCFCCSHCVQPGMLDPFEVALNLLHDVPPARPSTPRSSSGSLDHPPQLLG